MINEIYDKVINGNWRISGFFRGINKLFAYNEQEKQILTCMDFISWNEIRGDYLEFGVFAGRNFIKAYHFAKNKNIKGMRFFAFDSFEGLPELTGKDKDSKQFFKGQFNCSLEDFKQICKKKNVNLSEVITIKGWFNKVLNKKLKDNYNIKKAAYIFIDVDLYESTVPVLEFVTDLIQDGTIIVFDDYFCEDGDPRKGERKAFEDWVKKNNFIVTPYKNYNWNGVSFILHKK